MNTTTSTSQIYIFLERKKKRSNSSLLKLKYIQCHNSIPARLQQRKQQEAEEQHSQLCMSTVSCHLLWDPVFNSNTQVIL